MSDEKSGSNPANQGNPDRRPEDVAGSPCHVCTCTGFQPDPNDPEICIGPRPPQGRCQHSILNHF